MEDFFWVSIGAVLGANTRFIIYKKLEKIKLRKDFIILVINTFSCFCLGLVVSILPKISDMNYSYKLGLFCSIGYLGSLSTFSTFVYDLFDLAIQFKFFKVFKLFIISMTLGIGCFVFGLLLGNQ
tara:strand:- start:1244 stop:1618 length:375 start_codon:yes stop_codon:yes gene_type:complete